MPDGALPRRDPSHDDAQAPDRVVLCGACRSCGAQLGWRFEGPALFWGLIRRALRWP